MNNEFEENQKVADLHLHTTSSDGTDSVKEVIEVAKERGLDCIALTDHDVLHKGLKFRSKEFGDLEVINGCEIKAEIAGIKIEVLGYFLDTSNSNLQRLIEKIDRFRVKRMEEMVQNVNKVVEPEVTLEHVKKVSEGSLARPNLAKVMVNKGVVESVAEAFEKYISKEKSCYVKTKKLPAKEVIQAVHKDGGVTSLSHPGRNLPEGRAEELISKLVKYGLDALEVNYPYDLIGKANSEEINFTSGKVKVLADKFNLLKTGGSDSHGTNSDKDFLGEVKIPYNRVKALKALRE